MRYYILMEYLKKEKIYGLPECKESNPYYDVG